METFAIIGFIFGLAALSKIVLLEKKLKEKTTLKAFLRLVSLQMQSGTAI